MNITKGRIQKAKKVVIYGPEGIGKSTFASHFPKPVFIDTEGSTNGMDIVRTDKPTSWELLRSYVKELGNSGEFQTIIIDTIDWAEQLCIESICAAHQKKGIEDFGYGNGYVYEKEEMGKFLNSLQDIVDKGINVVLTAHAQLRKFEQPDEMGAYDRWELKLGKKTSSQISPLVKEWADMVLFANYKTIAVKVDEKGNKFKGQGGERVMYTSHHPCWDAKNRDGLPPEMPFSYQGIAHLFGNITAPQTAPAAPKAQPEPAPAPEPEPAPAPNPVPAKEQPAQEPTFADLNIPEALPQALKDLMRQYKVDESDIRLAVSQRGYFPYETPVTNYPEDFIKGCLVAAWSQLYEKYIKPNQGVPF